MRSIIKIAFICLVVVAIAWIAMGIFASISANNSSKGTSLPKIEEAKYVLVVQNTGTPFMTNSYEQFGSKAGTITYLLHGFWDLAGSGKEFKYHKEDFVLDEKAWGPIQVTTRRAATNVK